VICVCSVLMLTLKIGEWLFRLCLDCYTFDRLVQVPGGHLLCINSSSWFCLNAGLYDVAPGVSLHSRVKAAITPIMLTVSDSAFDIDPQSSCPGFKSSQGSLTGKVMYPI
jgi:hypothetical protein